MESLLAAAGATLALLGALILLRWRRHRHQHNDAFASAVARAASLEARADTSAALRLATAEGKLVRRQTLEVRDPVVLDDHE
jgi:LPXTG-motif cell wall-anchored protein